MTTYSKNLYSWYSAHNFIIEAYKIYERSKYYSTWEILLDRLLRS